MPKRLINQETASPDRKAMAQRLNDLRVDRHWTQKELATRAGIHPGVITSIESGHVVNPTADSIIRMAKTFNVRAEWLLDGAGEKFLPGPVKIPEAETVTIERVPLEMAKSLLKVVEEMQYSRLFCSDTVDAKHIDRWLGCLLAVPELRSIGDHFMRAALDEDPAQPGTRPRLVVNNTSLLPERTVESGVVLPAPAAQPVVVKTAALRTPPADRASTAADDTINGERVVISFDPHKGTKLGKIKKGSYTDIELRKRQPMRKDGLLRQADILAMLGISAGTFWQWQQTDPDFPKPAEVTENGKITGYKRSDFECVPSPEVDAAQSCASSARMNVLFMQLMSTALCLAAMALNLQQARKWAKAQREMRQRLRPVCQVILHVDGERQLGIFGSLPEPGTTLYVLDEDTPRKPPREKVLTA